MKSMKKKDYIFVISGFILILSIVLTVFLSGNFYGSTLDYESQHYFIPEYFRTLFYDTHELLPDFAFNLGAGQNIYYFAYYGLLSPIILISYLFPFIPMNIYIVISGILLTMLSGFLIYKFIKNNGYKDTTAFIIMFIYLCAAPILFHTHRHIMFVNYMPFVLFALMSVDYYFETGRRSRLALSLFLIIMTSYFFSFSSLFIVLLYGIFKYTKKYEVSIKSFFKEGFKFLVPFFIAVLMSAVLLLPVLYTLLNGREVTSSISLLSLIKPDLNFGYLLYGTYTMGLTSLSLIAIVNSLRKNSKYKLLSIFVLLLLIFPIFNYFLNGTLYLNGKVFIPLIPVVLLMVSDILENKDLNVKLVFTFIVIMTLYNILFDKINLFEFYLDFYVTLLILLLSKKKDFIKYLIIPALVIICFITNLNDNYIKQEDLYNKKQTTIESLVNYITKEDNSFYRLGVRIETLENTNHIYNIDHYSLNLYSSTFNKTYNKFYYDVFNNNIEYRNRSITSLTNHKLFNDYMGVKYLITDYELKDGYTLVKELNDVYLYKSLNYYSVGYGTSEVINIEEYNSLEYPSNIYSLINGITVDKETTIKNKIEEVVPKLEIVSKDFEYTLEDDVYKFNLEKTSNMKIKTDVNKDYALFIQFEMLKSNSCSKNDTYIVINGNMNKLTCKSWKYHNQNYTFDYLIYDNPNELDIKIYKGEYEITNVKFYKVLKTELEVNITRFNINKNKTRGDIISGNINMEKDGYFVLTVPYDKGFNIYVDNKIVEHKEVNNGLIGFELEKGLHNIKITYEAPFKKIGIICGIIGLVGLIGLRMKEVKLWKKSQL